MNLLNYCVRSFGSLNVPKFPTLGQSSLSCSMNNQHKSPCNTQGIILQSQLLRGAVFQPHIVVDVVR